MIRYRCGSSGNGRWGGKLYLYMLMTYLVLTLLVVRPESYSGITWSMMTSSLNRNIFRVSDPLCWEFTDQRWIPLTKTSDAEIWYFLWSTWINSWVNNRDAGDLRRAHIWLYGNEYQHCWCPYDTRVPWAYVSAGHRQSWYWTCIVHEGRFHLPAPSVGRDMTDHINIYIYICVCVCFHKTIQLTQGYGTRGLNRHEAIGLLLW